nr:hypothetical protein Itr_chr14CG08480 [Ipomoea trifida]
MNRSRGASFSYGFIAISYLQARRRDRPPTANVREAKATESVRRALVREATARVRACEEGQEADCRERLAASVVAVLAEQAGAGGGQGVTTSSAERHSRFQLAFSNFDQETGEEWLDLFGGVGGEEMLDLFGSVGGEKRQDLFGGEKRQDLFDDDSPSPPPSSYADIPRLKNRKLNKQFQDTKRA